MVFQLSAANFLVPSYAVVMSDDRVVIRSHCNVLCQDTSGYVTAGNSRLVSGYLFCRGKQQPASGHEQCEKMCVYRKLYASLFM